jgi:hypothetical protein
MYCFVGSVTMGFVASSGVRKGMVAPVLDRANKNRAY